MDKTRHGMLMGYLLWLVGFTGAHRFYYGRPVSGTIWFFTLGLFGVGWLVDFFLMPSLARSAQRRGYYDGDTSYDLSWLLLTFLGLFGIHRFYLGKWGTGLIYAFTAGLFGVGLLYDYWTLNLQISALNRERRHGRFHATCPA